MQWSSVGHSHWLQASTDSVPTPTDSTAAGICIYYFIMPTNFWLNPVSFICLFIQVQLWLTAQSRVNMWHSSPSYFSKCLSGHFLHVPLHLFSHPTAKIKQTLYVLDDDLLIMWQLSCFNSYLNYFFFLSWCGWLFYMHPTQLHFLFKKHHRAAFCNSLRKLKTSLDQHLGSPNPGYKPCDPGHSNNIFFLDSYMLLPEVTGWFFFFFFFF